MPALEALVPWPDFRHVRWMKALLVLLLGVAPVSAFAQGGLPNQPYIYVEGKAEVEKQPDFVTLRFDVVVRNADQSKANQDVQAAAAKVLGLLDERKVAKSDVVAQDLKSEPQYEEQEEYGRKRGKIVGYSVTRSFAAKVRELAGFPKLVNDLMAIAGIEFSSIETGFSKEQEVHDEVWQKALADAREQAEKNVKAVGMKIDSVFAVSPVPFPDIRQRIFRGTEIPTTAEAQRAIEAPNPQEYRLVPVTLTDSVHVIYLMSPAK
jgi:uncharacterized protein YggE